MATLLTIDTTPLAINTAYRAIKFELTSTDAAIRAVRGDLYINGTYLTTLDGVQLLGETDQFSFDIRKVMQSVLQNELRTNITSLAVTDAATSAATIKMRFFEIVEASGVFTSTWAADGTGTNYLASGDYNVVNMAQQHQEVLADWTVDDDTKKLLTLRSDNNRIPRGVPFQIGCLSTSGIVFAGVRSFDGNLVSIAVYESLVVDLIFNKGVIEIPASIFSSSAVKFIEVTLVSQSFEIISLTYRYKVVDNCDNFVLFWQNHLGGFDHFDFGTKVTRNINTSSQKIKKSLPSGFSSEDAGVFTIDSTVNERVRVQTGALSATELVFLSELIKNHSVVYKWDSAGVFLKYNVVSHSKKIADNDNLINTLALTLEPSNEHIVQKGE